MIFTRLCLRVSGHMTAPPQPDSHMRSMKLTMHARQLGSLACVELCHLYRSWHCLAQPRHPKHLKIVYIAKPESILASPLSPSLSHPWIF
jgi:hypothetical protein